MRVKKDYEEESLWSERDLVDMVLILYGFHIKYCKQEWALSTSQCAKNSNDKNVL